MDLILELAWMLIQLVLELVFALPGSHDAELIVEIASSERFWLCIGYVAGGFILGTVSGLVLPQRFLPAPETRGISLALSPLVSGVTMHLWGTFRRAQGRSANSLATWWGGASFAFGCAVGRFLIVA